MFSRTDNMNNEFVWHDGNDRRMIEVGVRWCRLIIEVKNWGDKWMMWNVSGELTNYWRLELVFGSGHRTKVSGGRRLVPWRGVAQNVKKSMNLAVFSKIPLFTKKSFISNIFILTILNIFVTKFANVLILIFYGTALEKKLSSSWCCYLMATWLRFFWYFFFCWFI